MKNKFSSLSIMALLMACFMSCATTKFVEVTPEMSPVAIMTVNISNSVEWEGEETSSGLAGFIADKSINNNADDEETLNKLGYTKSLFKDAVAATYDAFEKDFGCNVIAEEDLFAVDAYANADEAIGYKIAYDRPAGYMALNWNDKVVPAAVASETGAQTFVYVTFNVCKVMYKGVGKNGSAKGSVTAIVTLADAEGNMVAEYRGYAQTDDTVAVVLGNLDGTELMPLLKPVFKTALYKALHNEK